ncbi:MULTISPECIES: UDP-N-acetylmuramoyl-L-alanine--D-glutamate ligase [unclassified Synechococcus]|uniref:UDP-N-acetylmuramoyl-L-alanine--D-glutamate ligase n=1 Tax=unclassified Synechococcus TaxID=2626047 RepID=UPI0000699315|nr:MULTISPECIES: UDP-N-acetylmuramoyl-L-alanine--D-glutamate ligase [unclassified Synechococcus]EAQ76133.1 UDP-N-acetylmuramoyl-L-alanyl-D-glutamate synthetase [Synechococcus sp. WH 5701]WFN58842.1 UDP-N-acetylmuramoyl-L-alanine--D-glutamate ligase [Synechococcus sp. CCFWC 502]
MPSSSHPLAVVIGLGRSGSGAARLLKASGQRVLVLESRRNPELEQQAEDLRAGGVEVELGQSLASESFAQLQPGTDRVVVSPGIRWDHPVLKALRERGVRVCGEMSVAWEASNEIPWIGITGTNGKTTVTHLLSHILNHAGLDAPMVGNVGISAAELLIERREAGATPPDWLVVELSSYQIESSAELAPRLGLWTTLTPDHLERHGTLEAYRAIKRSLLQNCGEQLLNADDADLRAHAGSWDRATWVTAGTRRLLGAGLQPFLWIDGGMVMAASGPLFSAAALALPGAHNRQNMVLAAATALKLGLEPAVIEAALRSFPGVPHRLEQIRLLDGVRWFNDSKATNYDAAEVGITAVDGPMVVLAGGEIKQGDPEAWLEALGRQAAAVVLFGAAREAFAALLSGSGYAGTVELVEGQAEAVPLARELARRLGCPTVLLSPACASFDQYKDFEARGEHFRTLVAAL